MLNAGGGLLPCASPVILTVAAELPFITRHESSIDLLERRDRIIDKLVEEVWVMNCVATWGSIESSSTNPSRRRARGSQSRTHIGSKEILGRALPGTKRVALAIPSASGWTLVDGIDLNQLPSRMPASSTPWLSIIR